MKLRRFFRKIKYKFIPYSTRRENRDFEFLNHDTDKLIVCKWKDYSGKLNADKSYDKDLNRKFGIGTKEKIVRIEGYYGYIPSLKKGINLTIFTMSSSDYKNSNHYANCKIKEYERAMPSDDFFELFKEVDFILLMHR